MIEVEGLLLSDDASYFSHGDGVAASHGIAGVVFSFEVDCGLFLLHFYSILIIIIT